MSIEKHPTREGWYYVKHYPRGRKAPPERRVIQGYDQAYALDLALKKKAPAILHPKLQDAANGYLEWCKLRLSPVTFELRDRRLHKYILPFFGHLRVSEIDQSMLDRYATTVGRTTYRSDYNSLMALIKWMQQRGYCDRVLHFKPERPNPLPKKQVFPTFDRMIQAIESMPKETHRVLFYFQLFSALRWNEVKNIRWENVSLRDGTYKLAETNLEEILPLPEPVIPWLEKHQKATGYVFQGRFKNTPYSHLWRVWGAAGEAIGLHISSHTFRRCAANHLYKMTGDIHLVQRLLRHRHIQTTLRYIDQSVEAQERGMSLLVGSVVNSGRKLSI